MSSSIGQSYRAIPEHCERRDIYDDGTDLDKELRADPGVQLARNGRFQPPLRPVGTLGPSASISDQLKFPPDNAARTQVQSGAVKLFRRELEISPTAVWGHYFVAMALWAAGNAGAALDELQKESDASGRDGGLVVIYQTLHRFKDAETAFAHLQAESSERWPFGLAFACAVRGQTDQAFVWLEKAYTGRDPSLWAIKRHPYLRNLESDPRYKAFLQKMNLPE